MRGARAFVGFGALAVFGVRGSGRNARRDSIYKRGVMGAHRPIITCHFEMHGHVADFAFGWCNWSDNGDGIDQRIVDWFREQSGIAIAKWRAEIDECYRERRARLIKTEKLETLKRLKAKYEKM